MRHGRSSPGRGGGPPAQPVVEGAGPAALRSWSAPSTSLRLVPLPASGEDFASCAAKLAGMAGVAFGWGPDSFWRATPAELAVLVGAVTGGEGGAVAPPDAARIAQMREAFPDG